VAFIASWPDLKPHGEASHLNVYYEILDEKVPPGIRNRTYYLGVIYRIGFESVYFAASSLIVLLVITVFPGVGFGRADNSEITLRRLFGAAAVVHLVVLANALWRRYADHRRKDPARAPRTRRARWRSVLGDIDREIPEIDRAFLLVAIACVGLNLAFAWRWAAAIGVGIPAVLWGARYFWGVRVSAGPAVDIPTRPAGRVKRRLTYPIWWFADHRARIQRYFEPRSRPSRRQNLHAVSAALLFATAAISLCLVGAVHAPSHGPLNTPTAIGWLSLTAVAAILVTTRSHERKLTGSYGTIRTWLERNRETLTEEGYFVAREAPGLSATRS